MYCKAYTFLVIDTTLASDNSLSFKKNPLDTTLTSNNPLRFSKDLLEQI